MDGRFDQRCVRKEVSGCLKELDNGGEGGGRRERGRCVSVSGPGTARPGSDSRPLRGSQVFSPGAANSLWWCSYMSNYALEPACLYLSLAPKQPSICEPNNDQSRETQKKSPSRKRSLKLKIFPVQLKTTDSKTLISIF